MSNAAPQELKPGILRWMVVGIPCYLGWFLCNLVLALIFPLLLFIGRFGGTWGTGFLRRFFVSFFRLFFLGYLPLIRVYKVVELPNSDALNSIGPTVFVSNHRSWLDALVLYTLLPKAIIPINPNYLKVPLAGTVMGWLGAVPFDRKSRASISVGVEVIKKAIRNGQWVAAFPEATRAPFGQLKPFSDVFFKIAIDENMPIVPIIIHLSLPFLGPGTENFLTAKRAELRIELFEGTNPQKGDRGADLGRLVYKKMASRLKELDDGNR